MIFPIDARQQPAGDYVYLEPDFYEALHRLSSTSRLNSPSWLVESARYRFSVPSLEHAAGAGDVQASFEIHSLQPETTVTLPLRRDQVLLVEGRAKLDGQPTTLAWANDGNGLSIAIQNPGKHRLEISVVPIARTTAERLSVDMTLPRAAISVAVLPSTAEVSDQVVVSPMQSDSVDSMRQIYLRGDRLTVRWPVADGGVLARPAEEGGQCLWWRIRPGSVTLEGRFQLRQKGGAAHDVSIEVDGRLRLLPRVNSESIPLVRVEEGATNRIRVAVGEHAPEVNFRLSWLWPDASGPGKLVLPKVRLLTERTTHDLTAISADSGLTVNGLSAADGEVSSDEFLRIWGETDLRPDLLFRQSAVDQYPTVFVTPRQSSPAVKQLVEWSVSKSAAMMLGTLKLTGVPGSRFEHRVLLPAPSKSVK